MKDLAAASGIFAQSIGHLELHVVVFFLKMYTFICTTKPQKYLDYSEFSEWNCARRCSELIQCQSNNRLVFLSDM